MAKKYTVDELNHLSADSMKIIILSMQEQLNQNMERLIEQIAAANNQRFGRSSEKLEVIDVQLNLDFFSMKLRPLPKHFMLLSRRGKIYFLQRRKNRLANGKKI